MQYDWKKIINSQKESTLTVKEFCRQNNICVSSFYKSKRRLENDELQSDLFVPVDSSLYYYTSVELRIP